jgi:hypothetical protein
MRIAFLCSGLEPGRDGIGDCTRALATACVSLGHETRLAAIRDPFCPSPASFAASAAEPRWPDIFCHEAQSRELRDWLQDFQPDWVSVQYTPFGFHRRGLGGRHGAVLRSLLPETSRRHVFFHEIWLQPGRAGRLRHRALGWFQRRTVDAWAGSAWQPHVVHTQARLHQARLRARGLPAELLPLCSPFANPHASPASARDQVAAWLRAAAPSSAPLDKEALWIGHFGTFYREGWSFADFAAKFTGLARVVGRRVCFLALGRARAAAEVWEQAVRVVPHADFRVVGELPPDQVAVAMQACDAAMTSTPWDIIEKSSAAAAWRALGIPVLVTRGPAPQSGHLPAWPDLGLLPAFGSEPGFTLPFVPVPGPAFLHPVNAAQAFLAALSAVHSPRL